MPKSVDKQLNHVVGNCKPFGREVLAGSTPRSESKVELGASAERRFEKHGDYRHFLFMTEFQETKKERKAPWE